MLGLPEWVIQVVLTAVLSIVGWSLRRAIATLDAHAARIDAIETDLARNYVRQEHMNALRKELRAQTHLLTRIRIQLAVVATKMGVPPELPNHDDDEDES